MLAKLMKYEFRSALRLFIPLWAAIPLLALINRLLLSIPGLEDIGFVFPVLRALFLISCVLGMLALPVAAPVFIVRRFYTGLLRDEGYLMFTTPASVPELIWSKCICGTVLAIVTGAIDFGALYLLTDAGSFFESIGGFRVELFPLPLNDAAVAVRYAVILAAVAVLGGLITFVLKTYLSMSLGQIWGNHRILLSIVFYVLINGALSALSTGGIELYSLLSGASSGRTSPGSLFGLPIGELLSSPDNIRILFYSGLSVLVLFYVIQGAILYFPTRIILAKRLNLE